MNVKKTALRFVILGQDGFYLSQLLITKAYDVWGASRDSQLSRFENLNFLGIRSCVKTISIAPNDVKSALNAFVKSAENASASKAEDFVIATGQVNALQDLVLTAFEHPGLNWRDYVTEERSFFDLLKLCIVLGAFLKQKFNWEAEAKMREVAQGMVRIRLSRK